MNFDERLKLRAERLGQQVAARAIYDAFLSLEEHLSLDATLLIKNKPISLSIVLDAMRARIADRLAEREYARLVDKIIDFAAV